MAESTTYWEQMVAAEEAAAAETEFFRRVSKRRAEEQTMTEDIEFCSCGSGKHSYWDYDARGIPTSKVCDSCRARERSKFRADIFEDCHYYTDEPIDEDY